MRSLRWRIAAHALSMMATVLLGGLISATLVRLAPGFDADERELDPHLNARSLQALHEEHRQAHNVLRFYMTYMERAAKGDWEHRSRWGNRCANCCMIAFLSRCVCFLPGLGWRGYLRLLCR